MDSEDVEEAEVEVSLFIGVGDEASFSDGLIDSLDLFLSRVSGLPSAGRFVDLGFSLVSLPDGWACRV